jgi:hypothetical protein
VDPRPQLTLNAARPRTTPTRTPRAIRLPAAAATEAAAAARRAATATRRAAAAARRAAAAARGAAAAARRAAAAARRATAATARASTAVSSTAAATGAAAVGLPATARGAGRATPGDQRREAENDKNRGFSRHHEDRPILRRYKASYRQAPLVTHVGPGGFGADPERPTEWRVPRAICLPTCGSGSMVTSRGN